MLDSTSESAQRPPHSVPPHTLIEDTELPARQLSSLREMAMHSGGGRVEVTYEGAGLPDESILSTFLLHNMLQKHVTKQSHISTSESAQRPPHSVPPHTLFQDAESPARQLSSHREMTMYSGGGRVEVT